jgi:hypothetical protein
MAQCPQCHSDVKPEERFCANCGARLEHSTPSAPTSAGSTPSQPTGKETIVLPKITDLGMQPPAARPPADATLIATPQAEPPLMPTSPLPSNTPTIIGGAPPYADLPTGVPAPPPAKSGSSVWKILAIVAGVGVLACVALAIAGYLLIQNVARNSFNAVENGVATANASGAFATIGAELERAAPTAEALATIEPEAATAGGEGGPVLYSDDFADQQSSSIATATDDSSVRAFVDGGYSITVKKPNLLSWSPLRGSYDDVATEVDTTIDGPELSAAGLIFHFQDDNNFYMFRVAGDSSYKLDMYKDDEQKTLIDWTDEPLIKGPGEVNKLRVETKGDIIRLYVNGKLLDEISDGTFTRGKLALLTSTFDDPNVTVKFDNLVVRGLN